MSNNIDGTEELDIEGLDFEDLLGDEDDIAKECASLMLYNKDHGIYRTFNKVFTRLFNLCRKF